MLKMYLQVALLFCGIISFPADGFVGINIGTEVSNLPNPAEIVGFLSAHQISHVRLYDTNARMLTAFSDTGIEVMISVRNEEIPGIGELPSRAAAWISRNVAAYLPSTNITAISVGSEVFTSVPHVAPVLVSAMNNLHRALVASNLASTVKVSTPHSMDVIPLPFPPSSATFNTSWNSAMIQILQFLRNANSFYMLNAYPYYEYVKSNGIFPLEYALFRDLPSAKQIVDPNTLLLYRNMFDALVDATYYCIAALNFSGIPIVVTETGWPSFGGASEPYATPQNAEIYNKNLITRASNNSGPPSQPSIPVNVYIYELLNEDHRPGPISERNWGILFSNGSSVYELNLIGASASFPNSSSSGFCVAKPSSDESALRKGLNWACGPGHADCSAIQQGHPCFSPDTLQNHASYAYNDYYQRMQSSRGTCDFGDTAMITTVDPSYGSCRFSRASNESTQYLSPVFGPTRSGSTGSKNGESLLGFNAVVVVNMVLLLLRL